MSNIYTPTPEEIRTGYVQSYNSAVAALERVDGPFTAMEAVWRATHAMREAQGYAGMMMQYNGELRSEVPMVQVGSNREGQAMPAADFALVRLDDLRNQIRTSSSETIDTRMQDIIELARDMRTEFQPETTEMRLTA